MALKQIDQQDRSWTLQLRRVYPGNASVGEGRFPSLAFTNNGGLEKIEELLEKQQSKDSGFISQLGWSHFVATKWISVSKFDLRSGHFEYNWQKKWYQIWSITLKPFQRTAPICLYITTTTTGPRLCPRPNTSDSWTAVGTLLDQETLSIVCREELLGLQMVALYRFV